jgi:hypothetical protein
MRKLALILVLLAPTLAVAEATRTISTSGNNRFRSVADGLSTARNIRAEAP